MNKLITIKQKKIIIGNWKMNPDSLSDAKRIFTKIVAGSSKFKEVETIICPPSVFLGLVGKPKNIKLGGQDGFYESTGPHTGLVSISMLKSLGAEYLIVGHSEIRQAGETDDLINKKIKTGLKLGLKIVLCIGEEIHDENGEYLKILQSQLLQDLALVPKKYFNQIIVAHEPVWAIGSLSKNADNPESFAHNRLFIKKVLADLVGKKVGLTVPVLYGGSVGVKNSKDFLTTGEADGLLIGRVSLIPDDFIKIITLANN